MREGTQGEETQEKKTQGGEKQKERHTKEKTRGGQERDLERDLEGKVKDGLHKAEGDKGRSTKWRHWRKCK